MAALAEAVRGGGSPRAQKQIVHVHVHDHDHVHD